MENRWCLPASNSIPSPIFMWYPSYCMLQDKCITIPFHSAVNGMIWTHLTHWGRVMQICVYTLQLCKMD